MGKVISVEGLSKRYRIGSPAQEGNGRRPLVQAVLAPFANLRASLREPDPDELIWALKDVSFEVETGEVLGIIGENGAGKSTLLKILSRITEPTAGRAVVKGRVGSILEVGTGFHPELTGRENIYLNGAILGMYRAEINGKFEEIVDFSGVSQFIDTPVKRYSTGMYVRLAFAVAAHLEPEILLVDEVLAVGDTSFQKKCLGKLGDVAREGRTVLFVSHNIGAISNLCDRCLLIEAGSLKVDGTPDEVIRAYLGKGFHEASVRAIQVPESDAYFNELAMYDFENNLCTRFDVRQPITVLMKLTLERRIEGMEVGISVHDDWGVRVFYSSNTRDDPGTSVEAAGNHMIAAQIPGRLLPPGRYYISATLHRPNMQSYDQREQVLTFDIEETGSGLHQYLGADLGYVLVDLKWEKRISP